MLLHLGSFITFRPSTSATQTYLPFYSTMLVEMVVVFLFNRFYHGYNTKIRNVYEESYKSSGRAISVLKSHY